MNTRTALIFIGILGAIVALIFFVRPPADTPSIPGADAAIPAVIAAGSRPTPIVAPTGTPLPQPTPTVPPGPGQIAVQPSATPLAYTVQQLQTYVPPVTLSPDDATATAVAPDWRPPGLSVPIAHNPWDHYWFIRPVESNYNNEPLIYYPYGSNGDQNDLRIHHGIDFPNPIGVEIHAAGDGTVIWAGKGHFNEFESITAYGNCVVVDHDFGYQGLHVYTLYAHMSAIVATKGQHVKTGDVIGLIGATGQVTGPHVHFEVRIGRDSYFAVRNPVLWMAPYIGTGTVAGRIVFPTRQPVNDTVMILINRANGRVIQRTTSYAGFGVNGDDNWKENFVFGDVAQGSYIVTSRFENTTWYGEVDVLPGTTNWVNLQRFTPDTAPIQPQQP